MSQSLPEQERAIRLATGRMLRRLAGELLDAKPHRTGIEYRAGYRDATSDAMDRLLRAADAFDTPPRDPPRREPPRG